MESAKRNDVEGLGKLLGEHPSLLNAPQVTLFSLPTLPPGRSTYGRCLGA